ncbi:hypothetical protein [Streptomyces sp. NPDC093225]|uniref:hypothetical protein n=1 Tax=Streptomyces sp. NPDC093225 TaxID=3366034 RepID=UPI00382F22C6
MTTGQADSALWTSARIAARKLISAHDQLPDGRADRERRFATWNVSEPMGEGSLHTLVALGLFAEAREAETGPGKTAGSRIADVRLSVLAARIERWPKYELLAGLPEPIGSGTDEVLKNVVTVLIRSGEEQAALALERFSRVARAVLVALQDRQPHDPTCGEVVAGL